MATRIHNTGITFPDSSTQTTAAAGGGVTSLNGQTGVIDNTTQYAIGSYVLGRPNNYTTTYNNSTIAGSSLYATGPTTYRNYDISENIVMSDGWVGGTSLAVTSLVNTGSWRCVSIAGAGYRSNQGAHNNNQNGIPGLWVRYA